ncbi:MAG: ATP-binding cassette domain-containing protein [Bacilli bacterium]
MFKIVNLRFSYPKAEKAAVNNISFEINKGEIFGFLGPSGAGKSTTQKILIKLLDNYQGQIFYDGKDLKTLGQSFYEDIGVSFEMPIHFSKLTAVENLSFFAKLYQNKADINDLLKKVGLYEDRNKKVGEFSKGMKVRLNFCRALLNNPKMLFLDEPTNGLDPANAMILKNMIKDFKKNGGTVFITSHIMSDIDQLCDRVAFIVDGQLKLIDTPRNLKLQHGKNIVKIEYLEDGVLASREFPLVDLGNNPDFNQVIKANQIQTIHSGETTLEDIFIRVTGVNLDDE